MCLVLQNYVTPFLSKVKSALLYPIAKSAPIGRVTQPQAGEGFSVCLGLGCKALPIVPWVECTVFCLGCMWTTPV